MIDHPMINGDPNALLIVTRRMFPIVDSAARADEAAASSIASYGVGYNPQAGQWMIGQPDGKPIAINAAFNVLVFKV
jgi:hypothetical protein